MKRITNILVIILFASCAEIFDEEPPNSPGNLRGYFTMADDQPKVHLSWEGPSNDDVSEYHVFRSIGDVTSFESLAKVSGANTMFDDTSVIWLENIYYKVRAEDPSANVGEFSDSIFVYCYKPGGNWTLGGYDSLHLCVDPRTYSTPEVFRLILDMPLDSIGDTAGIMDFTEIVLDTNAWTGTGWMYYTYSVVEMSDDSLNTDTVTYANTVAPEFCMIDLSEPTTGSIIFDSNDYESIILTHDVTSCDGDSLFP